MLGTTLPTPLYVIWQGQWGFSSGVVTLIFAVYAAGVLAALVFAGRASDQVGRRPVLGAALAFSALSTVVFILATSVGWLFLGRVLSGFSAGLMTGTATAALTDMLGPAKPRRASIVATVANTFGLGLGPLLAGLFAQYLPHPTVLVFEVYLALLAWRRSRWSGARDGAATSKALDPFRRLRSPTIGQGRVPGGRGGGIRRFQLARDLQRAGTDISRQRAAPTQSCRRRSRRVHDLCHFGCHPGRGRPVRLPEGRLVRAGAVPVGPRAYRRRLVTSIAGPLPGGYGRRGIAVGCVFLGSLSAANRLAPPNGRAQGSPHISCCVIWASRYPSSRLASPRSTSASSDRSWSARSRWPFCRSSHWLRSGGLRRRESRRSRLPATRASPPCPEWNRCCQVCHAHRIEIPSPPSP